MPCEPPPPLRCDSRCKQNRGLPEGEEGGSGTGRETEVVRDCEVSVVVVSSTAVTDPFGTQKLADRLERNVTSRFFRETGWSEIRSRVLSLERDKSRGAEEPKAKERFLGPRKKREKTNRLVSEILLFSAVRGFKSIRGFDTTRVRFSW